MSSPKKKVLIVGPAHPLRGGLSTFNHLLARGFIAENQSCDILTFKLQYPNFLFPGKTQYSSEPAPDINIHVHLNSVNPFNWIWNGLKYRNTYDLVIFRYWLPFMGPCLGTVARLLKWGTKTRIVAITDNIIPHEKRPGDQLFTRYFTTACHGFLSMSEKVLEDLKSLNLNLPATFWPHPLYESFGPPKSQAVAQKELKLNPTDNYLLFFGFIRKYKGLDIILKALPQIVAAVPNTKLIIAGEFYDKPEPYLSIIEEHKLSEHVILKTDFIPDSEVRNFFCAADLVVQPYKNATQSGVTQIAYYYDKPMVVTNVGGLAELVPHGKSGYIAEPNAHDVAQKIIHFFQKTKPEDWRLSLQKEKQRFSWKEFINQLWKVSQK